MIRILAVFSAMLFFCPAQLMAQDVAAAALEGAWVVSVGEQKDRFMIVVGAKTEKNEVRVRSTYFGWIDGKGKPVENWKAEVAGDTIKLSLKTPGGALVNASIKTDETSVLGEWTGGNGKKTPLRMTRIDEQELGEMRAAAAGAKGTSVMGATVTKDSKISLVYVGAQDCPSCRRFIGSVGKDGSGLKEIIPELADARFVYVFLWGFREPVNAGELPADMQWLMQPAANGKLPLRKRGTPFFAAIVDQRVIAQGHGVAALETLVGPAIKHAVEDRRAAK
jgi:hypothetical protein